MSDAAPPDIFVARQPIFDTHSNLFGYELLFRSSTKNVFASTDQEQASASVIANSFFVFGIGSLAGNARAFINFTRTSLVEDYAFALPRESLVVEVLENVESDDEVIAACERLKAAGYMIALDDFDRRTDSGELVKYANIVKIDFAACGEQERAWYAQELSRYNVKLLAEKVETRADADEAKQLGYSYLQGYFFARPEILVSQQPPALRTVRMQIISELQKAEPNMRKVEELFRHDPDLSYKLLRHLNSPAFAFNSQIQSIWRAITILGERGMRAWTAVVILAGLGTDKPSELLVTSVTRARFCQLIGEDLRMRDQSENLFLMGLFSLIDAITNTSMEDALEAIPLSEDARTALLGGSNRLAQILELVRLYEQGKWTAADQLLYKLGLQRSHVPGLYREALAWGDMSRAAS
ncbi:MAG: HDOD domain-containing protein [Chloroflexi bacterium]|nr:HDOD domain-containing protein [Chloroflexota bacterium]